MNASPHQPTTVQCDLATAMFLDCLMEWLMGSTEDAVVERQQAQTLLIVWVARELTVPS